MANFGQILSTICEGNPSEKIRAWKNITALAADCDRRQLAQLVDAFRKEQTVEVRREATAALFHFCAMLLPVKSSQRPQDWLFAPFLGPTKHSAIVFVSDRDYVKDAVALIDIARFLPPEKAPQARFMSVLLRNPDWFAVNQWAQNAICFVGRPGMFPACEILRELQTLQQIRFTLPAGERGRDLTPESAETYHHVVQARPISGPLFHKAKDNPRDGGEAIERTDWGVVQRLMLGTRAILIVGGASSLGTEGAAKWATSAQCQHDIEMARKNLAIRLKPDTQMEVLVKVKAPVARQKQPWTIDSVSAAKLFLEDNSIEGLHTVKEVVIRFTEGAIQYILFDEDEVKLPGKAPIVLMALCEYSLRCETALVNLVELLKTPHPSADLIHLFDEKSGHGTEGQARRLKEFIHHSLQKHRLRDAIRIDGNWVELLFRPKIDNFR